MLSKKLVWLMGASLAACAAETDDLVAPEKQSHVLAVAAHHEIALFDVETGERLPGAVHDMGQTTDLQALASGLFMVNLTEQAKVLAFDAEGTEIARIPSSSLGVTRPVHSFIYNEAGKEKYWIASSDHDNANVSSLSLFDIDPLSPTFLTRVGEHKLGTGHHKAAVSSLRPRLVISNMYDCAQVLMVVDFANPGAIKTIAALGATDAGWDGVTRSCNVEAKALPKPHGCAYAYATGRAYCNFTGTGELAGVDLDGDAPTFVTLTTSGAGSGYTKAHALGRYLFSVQSSPREGNVKFPGKSCQIGQLVVIDTKADAVVNEVPMFYDGPQCTRSLAGTPQAGAGPFRLEHTSDGKYLFVSLSSGMDPDGYIEREVVYDVSNPARPKQLPSIKIGKGSGHHGQTVTGDDAYLFVANNLDDSVSQIAIATLTVVRTLENVMMPHWVATFGRPAGPSHQVGPVGPAHGAGH